MTPQKALSIIKEANPLYYTQKKSGETVIKPDKEFLEAVNVIEGKLEKLEDIEEELGIDLATLFEALKHGIWSKGGFYGMCYLDAKPSFIPPNELEIGRDLYMQYDRNDHTFQNYIEDVDALCLYGRDYEEKVYSVRIKDYGKTWALTKEELL